MHSLKMRKKSKYEMTLKLDINKAYDCGMVILETYNGEDGFS